MTPREKAKALYEKYEIRPIFEDDMADKDMTIVDAPDLFAMGKPVEFQDGRQAWLIFAAVGKLRELLQLLPQTLPFIAFYRRGKTRLHIYSTERFLKRSMSC